MPSGDALVEKYIGDGAALLCFVCGTRQHLCQVTVLAQQIGAELRQRAITGHQGGAPELHLRRVEEHHIPRSYAQHQGRAPDGQLPALACAVAVAATANAKVHAQRPAFSQLDEQVLAACVDALDLAAGDA